MTSDHWFVEASQPVIAGWALPCLTTKVIFGPAGLLLLLLFSSVNNRLAPIPKDLP